MYLLQPLQPLRPFPVGRIGHCVQQIAVAPESTAVLGRAGATSGEADDTPLVGCGTVRLLHQQLVPPVVAEVIYVDQAGTLVRRDTVQRDPATVLDAVAVSVVGLAD